MDINKDVVYEGASPRHQVGFRSLVDLPAGFELDAFVRFVDRLDRTSGSAMTPVPAYTTADVRVAWRGFKRFEVSVVGHSLLQGHHLEFPGGTEVERSVYGRITASF